jgi:hypothetical protein
MVEGSSCAIKRGFPRSSREGDNANVIFQVGRSQVFKSRKSTPWIQNFEEINMCAKCKLLQSQSTDDSSRRGGRPGMQG